MFKLTLAIEDIHRLIATHNDPGEAGAMEAGARIRAGETTRANLATIFEWKTNGRGRIRLTTNTDIEIADALSAVTSARTPRVAIGAATSLSGVDIPVASAIMTTIYPDRFTIIDFRALETLGAINAPRRGSLWFYLQYLKACLELSRQYGVTLRQLDYALWGASAEASKGVKAL